MLFVIMGIVTAFGIMLILSKLNFKRLAGYALVVDLVLTLMLATWFSGTISGLITGTIAGIVISLAMYAYVKFIGFDRYNFKSRKWEHTKGLFERWYERSAQFCRGHFYTTKYNMGIV